jgi:hypothetical protein
MDRGYALKQAGDLDGAASAFAHALADGYDPQVAWLELAYVDLAAGRTFAARRSLETVAAGPDAGRAAQARAELQALSTQAPAIRRDLYAEAVAWTRAAGAPLDANAVPTLRLRALHAPFDDLPLDVYAYAQATRDLASQGGPIPRIYADDRAVTGAGLQLRLLGGNVALYAQAGAAFRLIDDRKSAVLLDARVGAMGYAESRGCAPRPADGVELALVPCAEAYGEAAWLSRFENDVVALARGRAGATWLVSGPVAWAFLAEGRALADSVGHPYDNLVEAGLGHRWRLLRPVRVDLLATASSGVILRDRPADPMPSPRTYLDLRLVAATYLEF